MWTGYDRGKVGLRYPFHGRDCACAGVFSSLGALAPSWTSVLCPAIASAVGDEPPFLFAIAIAPFAAARPIDGG